MKRDILFRWTGEQFIEDGYYIDGEKVPVPNGYWYDNVNLNLPNGYYIMGVLTPLPECAEVGAIYLSQAFDPIPLTELVAFNSGPASDLSVTGQITLASNFDPP
jgi:hypothetical protein